MRKQKFEIKTFLDFEKRDELIFGNTMIVLSFLFIVFSSLVLIFSKKDILKIPKVLCTGISITGYITSILNLASIKYKFLRTFMIFLTTMEVTVLGIFQQISVSILYLAPVFIAYFEKDKRKVDFCLYISMFLFVLSKELRGYLISMNQPASELHRIMATTFVVSVLEAILFIIVCRAAYISIEGKNNYLKKELLEKEASTSKVLEFCSRSMSYHNKYLNHHIRGVKKITEVILDDLIKQGENISNEYYNNIIWSVQFHDLGKIYIEPTILDKPGKLTEEEFNLIKEHPSKGQDLFSLLPKSVLTPSLEEVCKNVIYEHHERINGRGYPRGLLGNEISFEAKIIAVADVVDALLSWRPYKLPMTWEKMVDIIKNDNGLDQRIVDIIIKEKLKILEISDKTNVNIRETLGLHISATKRE